MKGFESGPMPPVAEWGVGEAPRAPVPGDDFPTCLAEAIDILADRARRRGLAEVVHMLEVAALAARDSAPSPAESPCQPERECAGMPCSPA